MAVTHAYVRLSRQSGLVVQGIAEAIAAMSGTSVPSGHGYRLSIHTCAVLAAQFGHAAHHAREVALSTSRCHCGRPSPGKGGPVVVVGVLTTNSPMPQKWYLMRFKSSRIHRLRPMWFGGPFG
jgi:hypothetical protein